MTREVPASEASPAVRLEFRDSPIHGAGAFAAEEIPEGARVIQYLGEKISKSESVRRCELNNEYIFSYDEEWDLDGNAPWNPARLINHSCAPNCESQLLDGQIWIVALRPVPAGEEVTFNYGYDIEDFEEHPCRCAASNCAGFILAGEFFEKARRHLEMARWPSNVC
jgi:hypothetical protein